MCAAHSPANDAGANASGPGNATFVTQIDVPVPDYRPLIRQVPLSRKGRMQREATASPPRDAKAVGDVWIAGLKARDALLGAGLVGKGPDGPVSLIDTGLTEGEFEIWTKAKRWKVPKHIRWSFMPELQLPGVSNSAKDAIRVWPASHARTGLQNQALLYGRVEVRDGCFFVATLGKPAHKLAWFHAEVGLDRDSVGYLVLRDRVSGQTLARLGEDMVWGGPPTAVIDPSTMQALQAACGHHEIMVVGSPESRERFLTQYPQLRNPQPPPPPPGR